MTYDLKIIGATIVDGTRRPGYRGDVGVANGRVVAVGRAEGEARETIAADGLVVSPGFIDMHTHYDAQVLWDESLSISPWHGVTTAVMGNCGFGIVPARPGDRDLILQMLERVEGMSIDALRAGAGLDWPFESLADYLDALERRRPPINLGVYAGHSPTRLYVMGRDSVRREATPDEITAMARHIRAGIEAGALGFATSNSYTHNGFDGAPVPSRLASFAEVDALVAAAAAANPASLVQVSVGKGLFLPEFAQLARDHGVTIAWTALLSGLAGPNSHRDFLERTRALMADGLNVVPQTSPRPLCIDFDLESPFPFEGRQPFGRTMTTDHAGRVAFYRDAAFRDAFKADLRAELPSSLANWPARTTISLSPGRPEDEERPLLEVARERGVDPIDLLFDMSLASDLTARFRLAMLNDDEPAVAEILADPNTVIGLSDAGAHAAQLCDACYTTDLLGRWVREKKAFALEDAVWMLTARPAEVLGLADRGRLAEGKPADLVVFDPATVGAGPLTRRHDFPAGAARLVSEAHGIHAVVVNGAVIRRDGADTGARPGQVLRRR